MSTGFSADGMGMVVIAFIAIVAVIMVGGILFSAGRGLGEWSRNNAQPVLRVPAKIVARRTDLSVRSHHHHDRHHHAHTSTSTRHYATFELEHGERMEFQIANDEVGLLVEGDSGELTFQGTRYHGFARRLPDGSLAGGQADAPSPPPVSSAMCGRCEKPLIAGRNECRAGGWTQPG